MEARPTKLAIIGAGAVGTAVAYASLIRGVARTIALMDINTPKVTAEVLDMSHGLEFVPRADIIGDDDVSVCADADVVVFTAGAKQKPGQSRLELAEATIGLTKNILPGVIEVAPNAIYIMVTNPVDIVTYAALKISGLPNSQVFGSGTVLDSSRLRFLIAQHCDVAVQNVHAYIVGEHGDSEIPLWSSASIGGVPLLSWKPLPGGQAIDAAARERIHHEVVHSAYKIIEGKGATNYAIGLATARIVEAVLNNEHRVLPVSTVAEGYEGLDDVCLSLPTIVDRAGAQTRLEMPMSDDEHDGLMASAGTLREMQAKFGL
ncbi:L-lactate dehydrogenase [Gordonia bronchialis DSM 43247]|uniref:L-lactate dehydrogenase n=1 Tax=Gordonia bronchialis (strain ATCC 25592 / DSM 43247 / BCRC 13721 / JCM 3198 / KCTC 3076 / NBRC 16047 / NCTC 10667) TaxID=526226 RepID=D0L4X2_GORB4|nr:L-lactate dehydrogenase [Gordonia bronchialis]ACY20424.1 L-lactate dehydrogenase [Gordonia bronchialis DSM 43247]MCC3323200.1 L-lactate dehydrogenase [Gordonia bronchialis]QGS25778.1 L-lactate dehydrogenase [Gordonia bronchialis]UAK37823.1 L-lactate dehydrogenase [Gordonia bronchialis]STQ63229.1 L-lactate dehydrogenase 2 [Gordonia bronchialis]